MRTITYYFENEYGFVEPYEYDPPKEVEIEAIANFFYRLAYPDYKKDRNEEVFNVLKVVAEEVRWEYDHDDIVKEYCEEIAREEYIGERKWLT